MPANKIEYIFLLVVVVIIIIIVEKIKLFFTFERKQFITKLNPFSSFLFLLLLLFEIKRNEIKP
jgi:hypothetical protein